MTTAQRRTRQPRQAVQEPPPAKPAKKLRTQNIGRPPKFKGQETIDRVLAMEPTTVTGIAQNLGVVVETIYAWCGQDQAFSEAVNKCRQGVVRNLERSMLGQAAGEVNGNATAGIFMLKNLAPDQYRDRREHTVEVNTTVELNYTGFALEDGDGGDFLEGEFEEIYD